MSLPQFLGVLFVIGHKCSLEMVLLAGNLIMFILVVAQGINGKLVKHRNLTTWLRVQTHLEAKHLVILLCQECLGSGTV